MSDEIKLPEPKWPSLYQNTSESFSVDQLRAYGEACRQDEREKCLYDLKMLHIGMPGHVEWNGALSDAAFRIRARGKS